MNETGERDTMVTVSARSHGEEAMLEVDTALGFGHFLDAVKRAFAEETRRTHIVFNENIVVGSDEQFASLVASGRALTCDLDADATVATPIAENVATEHDLDSEQEEVRGAEGEWTERVPGGRDTDTDGERRRGRAVRVAVDDDVDGAAEAEAANDGSSGGDTAEESQHGGTDDETEGGGDGSDVGDSGDEDDDDRDSGNDDGNDDSDSGDVGDSGDGPARGPRARRPADQQHVVLQGCPDLESVAAACGDAHVKRVQFFPEGIVRVQMAARDVERVVAHAWAVSKFPPLWDVPAGNRQESVHTGPFQVGHRKVKLLVDEHLPTLTEQDLSAAVVVHLVQGANGVFKLKDGGFARSFFESHGCRKVVPIREMPGTAEGAALALARTVYVSHAFYNTLNKIKSTRMTARIYPEIATVRRLQQIRLGMQARMTSKSKGTCFPVLCLKTNQGNKPFALARPGLLTSLHQFPDATGYEHLPELGLVYPELLKCTPTMVTNSASPQPQ